MKKDILFVMNDLGCGGAEKALVSLLQTLDYSKFNVDLYLFKKTGLFLNQVPEQVNILPVPINYPYFDMSIKKAILDNIKSGKFKVIINRILAGFIYKTNKIKAVAEQKSWKYLSKVIMPLDKTYDIAVGYLEKKPNYFCVDKVKAKKKIGFIHNDYNKLKMDVDFDVPYFEKLDKIVTVSEECKSILINTFPSFKNKFTVLYNIVSSKTIKKLSEEPIKFSTKGFSILSMGRLTHQKGYDLAINACKILVDKNMDVYWYALGEGEEFENLKQQIAKLKLNERFVLLGNSENPYPFIKKADIYCQTSRFEGKSIAIDEAKILHKPIVVTNFSTVHDQLIHDKTALICDMNAQSIAKNIEMLYKNKKLSTSFSQILSTQDYGNEDEILKFYKMINN